MAEYQTAQVVTSCLMSMHQGTAKIYPSGYRDTNLTEIVRTGFNKSTLTLANDSANKLIKSVLTPARLENSAT